MTGINRVAIWSFDNMFSEEVCWDSFRFHKADMPYLLSELGITTSSPAFNDGRVHTPEGMAADA